VSRAEPVLCTDIKRKNQGNDTAPWTNTFVLYIISKNKSTKELSSNYSFTFLFLNRHAYIYIEETLISACKLKLKALKKELVTL